MRLQRGFLKAYSKIEIPFNVLPTKWLSGRVCQLSRKVFEMILRSWHFIFDTKNLISSYLSPSEYFLEALLKYWNHLKFGGIVRNKNDKLLFGTKNSSAGNMPLMAGTSRQFCVSMYMNGFICKEKKLLAEYGHVTVIKWKDLFDDTLKLKSPMCFMAVPPTDCVEISFHTWTSLWCVCVSIHSVVSVSTLHVCLAAG